MVSAVSTFAKNTGLLMAYGLVKPENECIPLRLMNTTDRLFNFPRNADVSPVAVTKFKLTGFSIS
jgi:hypothetical protein